MHTKLLAILRCPYCGSRLSVVADAPQRRRGDELDDGILACECSTFPVVAGIPVLIDDRYFYSMMYTKTALYAQQDGAHEQALVEMLRLEDDRAEEFRRLLSRSRRPKVTFRDLIDVLVTEPEGKYFIYRFSDPTYLVSQAIWRSIGRDRRPFARRALDLCGGAGHLTRVLGQLAQGAEVILTDADFRMLWLARRFTCPGAQPVCCDANLPLPFDKGAFSCIACSDAFHFIRSKEFLSREMVRLAGDDGVIAVTHAHNKLCHNLHKGWPLPPRWYRHLFADYGARLVRESAVLDSFLSRGSVDLAQDESDDELRDEPALCLIATRQEGIFRVCESLEPQLHSGVPRLNPLYRLEPNGEAAVLYRQFPSENYAEEFQACTRYLPERVELGADKLKALQAGRWNDDSRRLSESFIVLDLPEGY
jgi:SAM-dependent methyltransferase